MSKKSQKMPAGDPPSPAGPDEFKVLFPEERVGDYVISPWTLTQFALVLGSFQQIVPDLQAAGVNSNNINDFLGGGWLTILPAMAPVIPKIIALTLRLPDEEVAKMDAGTQAALGLRILIQNKDLIKNFWTLALGGLPGTGANDTLLH
jgi:hypothetical protein